MHYQLPVCYILQIKHTHQATKKMREKVIYRIASYLRTLAATYVDNGIFGENCEAFIKRNITIMSVYFFVINIHDFLTIFA